MDQNKVTVFKKKHIDMEDIKFKFLGLIYKQNQAKIPSMGLHPDLLNPTESHSHVDVQSEASQSTESEPLPDQDILESIEPVYYRTDDCFDCCRHELQKLPEVLSSKAIERDYKRLKQEHQVVSKKVLQLILQKQSCCKDEFQRILYIQDELDDALQICRTGRADLSLAKKQFTTASLGILANYQKKQVVQGLLNSLNTIKTLQRTEDRLQELLTEGNYPGAISLLLECQSAAERYKHFHCVAALNGKLQDTLEQAEEMLDQTLAKMCTDFEVGTYLSVQGAYRLLGKTQTAMDQLHMHFTAAIHNIAFMAVHRFAGGDMKRQYKQMCQSVSHEAFLPCLIELCKSLWAILSSYCQVVNWHNVNETWSSQGEQKDLEASFNKQYVKQKLENGMARMWHDVEIKISTYLMGVDLAYFKFEQFVQILGIVHRLIEVGEELCGSESENLQKSITKQCSSYFAHYHASRLDELKIFLENDGWELCPVKPSFVVTQLQEFKSLKTVLNSCKPRTSPDESNLSQDGSSVVGGLVQRYLENGVTPFDLILDETTDEDILANIGDEPSGYFSDDSDDDIPEELKCDFVDEAEHMKPTKKKHKTKFTGPMVTNTTLSVLRVCGKYLQMSRLFRSIAVTVIQNMTQFFELCLHTVHQFFTSDLQINSDSLYSPKLKLTLNRIRETLVNENDANTDLNGSLSHKVTQPSLSSIVNLTQPEKIHGLTKRVIAVESLVFLGQQYEILRPYLEHLVASPCHGFLHQFYSQTVASATDLRKPVYMAAASQAFDVGSILNMMAKVNWEVRDVMSQHSNYIDSLLRKQSCCKDEFQRILYIRDELDDALQICRTGRADLSLAKKQFTTASLGILANYQKKQVVQGLLNSLNTIKTPDIQILSMRLDEIGNRIPLPASVYNSVWENVAHLITHTLVEGFSNAKKCSNGGRALMQLDFTQLMSKFEKLTSLRPMPHREYVEAYVKAYYLPENSLEDWVKQHKEYSTKHLIGLISCGCQNNKKTRQRLISAIEDERPNR